MRDVLRRQILATLEPRVTARVVNIPENLQNGLRKYPKTAPGHRPRANQYLFTVHNDNRSGPVHLHGARRNIPIQRLPRRLSGMYCVLRLGSQPQEDQRIQGVPLGALGATPQRGNFHGLI